MAVRCFDAGPLCPRRVTLQPTTRARALLTALSLPATLLAGTAKAAGTQTGTGWQTQTQMTDVHRMQTHNYLHSTHWAVSTSLAGQHTSVQQSPYPWPATCAGPRRQIPLCLLTPTGAHPSSSCAAETIPCPLSNPSLQADAAACPFAVHTTESTSTQGLGLSCSEGAVDSCQRQHSAALS